MDKSDPCLQSFDPCGLKTLRPVFFRWIKCRFLECSWGSYVYILECLFHQNHTKNFPRAPRALFWRKFNEKHPSAAFGSTIRKTKTNLLFFLLPSLFVFSLGFFFWNGLRTKIESFEEVTHWVIFLSAVFWTPLVVYTTKKHCLRPFYHLI